MQHIEQITEIFNLCLKVNGIDSSKNACFGFGLKKCKGACIGEEFPNTYNERFNESIFHVNRIFEDNFILMQDGREENEKAVFLVEDGHYQGCGYIDIQDSQYGIEEIKECIDYEKMNPEADVILRNYMWSNPKLEISYF